MHKSELQQHLTGEIMSFPNTGKLSIPLWAALGWCQRADPGRESAVSCWQRRHQQGKTPPVHSWLVILGVESWFLSHSVPFYLLMCFDYAVFVLTGGSLLPLFTWKLLSELAVYEIQKVMVQLPCLRLLPVAKYCKIGCKFRRYFFHKPMEMNCYSSITFKRSSLGS